ncbi:MAG: hypothetical protein JO108_36560 [Acidobacteriaceae bacterium]|nr:hypothetical protein [Acidobacteriaceae bacterium]
MSTARHPRYPFAPVVDLRSVQISDGTCCSLASDHLPPASWEQLSTRRPQVLLGFLSDFRRLLEAIRSGAVTLEPVEHAVVTLLQYGDVTLSDEAREELWFGFQVPVYQVFLDPMGRVLLWECETQSSWHLEPGVTASSSGNELLLHTRKSDCFQTGFSARIECDCCACGREGQRLTSVTASSHPSKRRQILPAA